MQNLPAAAEDAASEASDRRLRRWVIAGCLAGAVLFLGAVALLFIHWARDENPSCLITVLGTERLKDAAVTITPFGGVIREPLSARFRDGEDNRLRFRIPAGTYAVTVRDEKNVVLFPRRFDPKEFHLEAGSPLFITVEPTENIPASAPSRRGK